VEGEQRAADGVKISTTILHKASNREKVTHGVKIFITILQKVSYREVSDTFVPDITGFPIE